MNRRTILLVVLSIFAILSTSFAEIIFIEVDDTKNGEWQISIKDGVVRQRPIKQIIKLGNPTQQPPDTNPPPTNSEFIKQIKTETQTVLTNGGTKTTGAAIASVYSIVGDRVQSGTIKLADWPTATKSATDALLTLQTDKDKWTEFRTRLGSSLTQIQTIGGLDTKEEVAQVLKDVANGMNQATGFSAQRHLDKNARTEKGILDGIDIEQIIKLIELIMRLLEAFGNK